MISGGGGGLEFLFLTHFKIFQPRLKQLATGIPILHSHTLTSLTSFGPEPLIGQMRENSHHNLTLPSRHHLYIIHLINGRHCFHRITVSLFFLVENKLFFWRSTSDNVSYKKFFVICFPCYVRYHFFLINIFFINFDNKLFFSAHIFNKLFFLTCGDKLFFSILF